MHSQFYTTSFYEEIRRGSTRSAEVIVPLMLGLLPVSSVVDIGCGDGSWLSVFRKLGVQDVLGLDGEYVDRNVLQIPQDRFQAVDLAKPFGLKRVFDLAISLEVVEHLPAESASGFVASLCGLAPAVLFSAAIPFQGGNHHINEQWPDKWAERFKEHKYVPVDFLRKRVWQNETVEWWYAQNTLLFVRPGLLESNIQLKAERERTTPDQLRLVHPRQYLYLQSLYREAAVRAENPPPPSGLKEASRIFLVCLKNAIRWRLGRIAKKQAPAAQPMQDCLQASHGSSVIDPIRRAFRVRLWHPLLNLTRPVRHALGLRQKSVKATDKQRILLRNGLPDATWVESGTFMGDTTSVLSRVVKMVYSIEPEPTLFSKAEQKFSNTSNVKIIRGLSEDVLPKLIPTLSGNVCFWLDGHYSAGITFEGPQETPIRDELAVIGRHITQMSKIVVMVDDVHCFDPTNPEFSAYPPADFLVDWAREHNLIWHIEQDIFIAKNH